MCLAISRQRRVIVLALQGNIAAPDPCVGKAGIERERPVIGGHRFIVASQLAKEIALVELRGGITRLQGQRLLKACERVVVSAELRERGAPFVKRHDVAWLQRKQPVELPDGVLEPAKRVQCRGADIEQHDTGVIEPQALLTHFERRSVVARLAQHRRVVLRNFAIRRLQLRGLADQRLRLFEIAGGGLG